VIVRARLLLEPDDGDVDRVVQMFSEGPVDAIVLAVEVQAEGSLLRHDLRPTAVCALSIFATDDDLPDERTGPLVRVHATIPAQEA
jgi:hypothetical protein